MTSRLDKMMTEYDPQKAAKHWIMASASEDLLTELEAAVARIELANKEGNPIMSAWLPSARAAIAKAKSN